MQLSGRWGCYPDSHDTAIISASGEQRARVRTRGGDASARGAKKDGRRSQYVLKSIWRWIKNRPDVHLRFHYPLEKGSPRLT